ncbi:MAG: hypothetical protein R3E66_10130 [bacterium]
MRLLMIGLAMVLASCSDDSAKDTPPTNNTVRDSGADIALSGDAGDNGDAAVEADVGTPMPGACAANVTVGSAFALDPLGEAGQFYSVAAFDGASIWVVYNRPQSMNVRDEGIFVVRLGCDGAILTPPTLVSPDADARNYSPTLAAADGRAYVLWVHQPNGGNAKQLLYVGFRSDGSRITPEPVDVTPSLGEMPLSETIWQPDLAATSDGAVLVAEVLGTETQVVVERFTPAGEVTATFLAFGEKGVDQRSPSVGVEGDKTWVVWTRYQPADPNTGTPEVPDSPAFVSFTGDSQVPDQGAPTVFPAVGEEIPLTSVSPQAGPNGEMFMAYNFVAPRQSLLTVRQLGVAEQITTGAGTAGQLNFRQTVVSAAGGGAIGWYRYTSSPQKSSVVLQAFRVDQGRLTLGPENVVLPSYDAIQPYGPGLAHLEDDLYFVTYTQGASAPEARVYGRFVSATTR